MTVAVIGAGVTGLAAAQTLAAHGLPVVVYEASSRPGGCVRTVPFMDRQVDVGAEALYAHAPGVDQLVAQLNLEDRMVRSTAARPLVASRRGVVALPTGFGPTGPARLLPLLATDVVPLRGRLRAGLEPFVPRTDLRGDPSVGTVLRRRFGDAVTAELIEPLAGGIHAGSIDELSLQATLPGVAALLSEHRSLLTARMSQRHAPPPSFTTPRDGLGAVVTALGQGLDIRTNSMVTRLQRHRTGWQLELRSGHREAADAVVLAVPAAMTADLLREADQEASDAARACPATSVTVVTAAYRTGAGSGRLAASGVLVPRHRVRTVRAATVLTSKWPHLGKDRVLIRATVHGSGSGNHDHPGFVRAVANDLARLLGLPPEPIATCVFPWPDAMPQYTVGHGDRRDRIHRAARALGTVAVAGAAFDGVGISRCVASGQRAAHHVAAVLGGRSTGDATGSGLT